VFHRRLKQRHVRVAIEIGATRLHERVRRGAVEAEVSERRVDPTIAVLAAIRDDGFEPVPPEPQRGREPRGSAADDQHVYRLGFGHPLRLPEAGGR
jgi:hypothetical protein